MVIYEEVLRDIIARDERDSNRAVAPLKCADDATLVDSTGKSIEEVIAEMQEIVNLKTK